MGIMGNAFKQKKEYISTFFLKTNKHAFIQIPIYICMRVCQLSN